MSDLTEYANLINQQTALNNSWSAEQAQKQMDFQERMSSTAHQREIADLKAAGLNPVLSANSGASTPTGAMGQTDTGNTQAITDIAIQLSKAQSAQAIANARSVSSSNGWNTRNWMSDLALDFYSELTGKDRDTLVKDAASNTKSIVNKVYSAVNNGAQNVAKAIGNIFGKKNKVYETKHHSNSVSSAKTYANGTKYRVSSSGRKALTS